MPKFLVSVVILEQTIPLTKTTSKQSISTNKIYTALLNKKYSKKNSLAKLLITTLIPDFITIVDIYLFINPLRISLNTSRKIKLKAEVVSREIN
jgi:hypothetical protein